MKYLAVQSDVTQNINMLNKLHMAMIELYKGDSRRIQHFCKVHSYARLIAQMENVDYEADCGTEHSALFLFSCGRKENSFYTFLPYSHIAFFFMRL